MAIADPTAADVIVALGGDGLMLQTLHRFMRTGKPIYGMNRGSVGFLMNEFRERSSSSALRMPNASVIHPLAMIAKDIRGQRRDRPAINEVSVLRQSYQAAKISHLRRRQGTAAGAGRRRRAAGDAGWLLRL